MSKLSRAALAFALALALMLFPLTGISAARAEETNVPVGADGMFYTHVDGSVILNSGYSMPVIGLGTWTLSNDEAENSVYHALKSGMRLIDTARYYGNEAGVGRGLRKAMDEGIVTRE